MLPDIDSLALFVRAAECGSLTKAAEASNIGAAGASRRISLLEARFKAPLFERSPRGMKLTPAGEWLLSYAKPVLNQMSEMQLVMKDFATGRSGALRILASASALAEAFTDDFASFIRQEDNVDLVVEERWSEEIAAALVRAEADLGLIVEGPLLEGLETFVYRSDQLGLVFPADHHLGRQAAIRFADLPLDDLITLEAGSSIARLLSEQAALLEHDFQPTLQVRSFATIATMVRKRVGIGVLPVEVAETLEIGADLVIRPLAEPWAKRDLLACVRVERTCNPILSRLLKHLSNPTKDVAPVDDAQPVLRRHGARSG